MNYEKKLSVSQAYTRGFTEVKDRPLFFLAIMLLIVAVVAVGGSLFDMAASAVTDGSGSYLVTVVLFSALFISLVGTLFKFGLKKIALRLIRGASVRYENLLVSYLRGVRYLVGLFIFNMLVLGLPFLILSTSLTMTGTNLVAISQTTSGTLALAVVFGLGGFLALLFHLYPYVLLDNPTGIVRIFQDAWSLTTNARFEIVVFYAVAFILNVFGAALFAIGLLFTIPITIVAQADMYQQLRKRTFSFGDAKS